MVCRINFTQTTTAAGPSESSQSGHRRIRTKGATLSSIAIDSTIVITIVGTLAGRLSTLESFGTVVAGSGGAFLLVQLARDAGKERERAFFETWGGLPSVAVLRHRDTRIEPITKVRYHKKLSTLVKGTKAPSLKKKRQIHSKQIKCMLLVVLPEIHRDVKSTR